MFGSKISLALVATILSAVSANPVPAALDVFVPPIIKPDATTVWQAGTLQNVSLMYQRALSKSVDMVRLLTGDLVCIRHSDASNHSPILIKLPSGMQATLLL